MICPFPSSVRIYILPLIRIRALVHEKLDWLSPRSIHVAGTKGKGSTSAMAESIVRHHGFKTGLFTSPHLITVRERIKINGKAISEDQFVKYFWIVWDRLQATRSERWPLMPGWFRFLNLLAFKIFQEESVDCAVVEVGMGGRGSFYVFFIFSSLLAHRIS